MSGVSIIDPLPPPLSDSLFAEANTWFFRLRAEDVSEAEKQAFVSWLSISPLHAQAWNEVQELFMALESPAAAIRQREEFALAIGKSKPNTVIRRRRLSIRRVAAAVTVCASILIFLVNSTLIQNLQSDYHTATGEQRRVELSDGSCLLLNTDTAVSINMQEDSRSVRLLRGEVFFEVAHAPKRPFWAIAGDVRARVTGTAFSVDSSLADNVNITVSEGRVETSSVSDAEQITPLTPGQSARYQDHKPVSLTSVDPQRSLSWRHGKLIFVQTPLADVVAEINRYRPGRLIITNEQLKRRPVTAVFTINQLDDAIAALERTLGIKVRKLTDYWVLLG